MIKKQNKKKAKHYYFRLQKSMSNQISTGGRTENKIMGIPFWSHLVQKIVSRAQEKRDLVPHLLGVAGCYC